MISYKIRNSGTIIIGYILKTSEQFNHCFSDYMFVNITDLKKSRYAKFILKYTSKYTFNNSSNRILKFEDIVVNCIDSNMNNVGIINDNCISNQQINAITNIDNVKVLPLCLYYLLLTKKNYLQQIGTNVSNVPKMPNSIFKDIGLTIQLLIKQQQIVDIGEMLNAY